MDSSSDGDNVHCENFIDLFREAFRTWDAILLKDIADFIRVATDGPHTVRPHWPYHLVQLHIFIQNEDNRTIAKLLKFCRDEDQFNLQIGIPTEDMDDEDEEDYYPE